MKQIEASFCLSGKEIRFLKFWVVGSSLHWDDLSDAITDATDHTPESEEDDEEIKEERRERTNSYMELLFADWRKKMKGDVLNVPPDQEAGIEVTVSLQDSNEYSNKQDPFILVINPSDSVHTLKEKIFQSFGIPVTQQFLSYQGNLFPGLLLIWKQVIRWRSPCSLVV
jgi:hypothetical protein